MERRGAVGPLGLEPDRDLFALGELAPRGGVALGHWIEVAHHEHVHPVADGNLHLRYAVEHVEAGDQLAQGCDQSRDVRRQVHATAHVGHVAGFSLMEADERAARQRQAAHAEAGAVPVAPLLAVDDGQQVPGLDLADPLQAVLEPALLGRHLGALVGVLRGAAATDAEVLARRLAPPGTGLEHADRLSLVERAAGAGGARLNGLACERALDEDDLALLPRDAAPFGVEGLDPEGAQREVAKVLGGRPADAPLAHAAPSCKSGSFQRERNSFQCGWSSFATWSRSTPHSRR